MASTLGLSWRRRVFRRPNILNSAGVPLGFTGRRWRRSD